MNARHKPSQANHSEPKPTARQAQFLKYIAAYILVHRRPPSEAEMMRHFQITAPSVHSMVLTLERRGFIARTPGQARSIRLLIEIQALRRSDSAPAVRENHSFISVK